MRVPVLALISLLALVGASSCDDDGTRPVVENPPWELRDDMMNFAVLLVDYETYTFQGGNLSYYDLCSDCDADSLPLGIESTGFGDITYVAFVYTETGDTVFYASSVYNGRGRIVYPYPGIILSPHEFRMCDDSLELPDDAEYLGGCGLMSEEECRARADRAWQAISQLDIVCAFAETPYRAGILFYPPSRALFDPSVAQWVVFLYRGKLVE